MVVKIHKAIHIQWGTVDKIGQPCSLICDKTDTANLTIL